MEKIKSVNMDDSISIKSSDSTTTSDEYEFVASTKNGSKVPLNGNTEPPLLKIVGNGDLDHLQKCLGEVLKEDTEMYAEDKTVTVDGKSIDNDSVSVHNCNATEEYIEPIADVCQECTLFGCISYLGSAAINAPKSKTEILRNMAILNEQSSFEQVIKVSVSVPNMSDGVVMLYDGVNNSVMARYDIQRIMFYACGLPGSNETSCFAFTYLHGDTQETALFQCHVFRCDIPEAVGQVTLCFGKAFQKPSNMSMTSSALGIDQYDGSEMANVKTNTQTFIFEVGLEIKENDGKGNYSGVPRDKNVFKLRTDVEKQIIFTIQQVNSGDQTELEIERCFGVLVSPGCNVKHSDMQLLDMMSMGIRGEDEDGQKLYTITGHWDTKELSFQSINADTSKLFLTAAVDLVIRRIREPVRLSLEVPIRMFPQNVRFWYFSKPSIYHQFSLCLREVPCRTGPAENIYEVISIDRSVELDKSRLNYTWNNLTSLIRASSTTSLEGMIDDLSDTDEPIVSGTGEVSKDCPDKELEIWNEFLEKWTNSNSKPKQLLSLVRLGIPEALRGEVWQRLVNCGQDDKLVNTFRILISKDCTCERIIQKDINRTFPAHDYFKDAGGVGQDTLFNISKAYAVYDTEIGYCQGLTFIAASLLLHMPEEQAFCVLVKLMYDYGLRDLYKDGFENLYLRLYQLNRLLEEKEPQLWQHFKDIGVEMHMFASHWFLTLYTARFPLYFVFSILDVTLVHGLDTIFQIALSLLTFYKKELTMLDFENILKFFQVTLPKKCRNDRVARYLIKRACNIKLKKLKKYEREFISLRAAEESAEQYNNELERLKCQLSRTEEEKKKMRQDINQLQATWNMEIQKNENENKRSSNIIAEYKQICRRLDKEHNSSTTLLSHLQNKISSCNKCSYLLDSSPMGLNNTEEKMPSNGTNEVQLANRITELELELAQTKLALVEAECRNQDLTHRLSATNAELQTVRQTYPPWLHKTLSSLKEVTAAKKVIVNSNTTNKLFNITRQGSVGSLNSPDMIR